MRTFERLCLLASGTAILLDGCAAREQPVPISPAVPQPTLPRRAPAERINDGSYVATSGSIELLILRSSELALQRSPAMRVREFATRMIEDHKGTSAQLSFAGRRLNLLPSAILQPREQSLLNSLAAASDFDPAYVRLQRTAHQELLAMDRSYASTGQSPTLRPVAAAAVPIEERHLRMLAYL